QDDVDLFADELVDAPDRAHLDTGHAHGRPRLEARHVVETRLQVVALPEEPAAARQHEDGNCRDGDCENRQDAYFQLGPGKRSCAWHISLQYVVSGFSRTTPSRQKFSYIRIVRSTQRVGVTL